MNVLSVRDLVFGYNEKKILNGINFDLEKGQCLCLFGPNGCGKSTMLDCILGLNKPESGKILIGGKDATKMTAKEKAREISYVTQKSDKTFPYLVSEIVLMGRTAYASEFSSPGKEDMAIAEAAIDKIGLNAFKDRVYTKLSGGETQLVKIARAIAQDTDIIVFDEPTSHLDFRHELNVIKYMASIIKEESKSALMATHFPNHALFLEAAGIDTVVAMMDQGVLKVVGKPSEVLSEKNMAEVFKVKIKNFCYEENNRIKNYIAPVDFVEGGGWHND